MTPPAVPVKDPYGRSHEQPNPPQLYLCLSGRGFTPCHFAAVLTEAASWLSVAIHSKFKRGFRVEHSHDSHGCVQLPSAPVRDRLCAFVRSGVLSRFKENIQSRRGPSVFQPYRDLWKLFHKDEIISSETTWIFRFTPYLVFVVPLFVTSLIPVLTDYPLAFAFMGDMLAGGFFLALTGFFAALAAVDTGNPYGPMRSKPDANGGVSRRPVFIIGVLHRLVCGAIDHSLYRAAKVGHQPLRVFLSRPYLAADCISHADPG